MNINNLKGNWTYFELAEGSSYQGFELLGENYGKRIKEIQRKSIFGSSKREVQVGEGSVIFGTSSLSFFLYNDRLAPSLMSKVIYKASYWDCSEFYIGKTKRR